MAVIFVDRDRERGILDGLLESALNGLSGALVVYGEAGMGKSALLDYAASSSGLSVARVSGVETESSFGFAALHRLLLPFLHETKHLPAPQRLALESAFGMVDGPAPDRFLVGLAALTLLSLEGTRSGLLLIVDDAQWIDVESGQTLGFVARRLSAEGIALLFGIRTYLEVPPHYAGIPIMELGGLPSDAALEVLELAAAAPVPIEVADSIVLETQGCPLALWELGSSLAESHGIGALAEPMALTPRLEQHFNDQISLLSPDAQLFLVAAAADISGNRSLIQAAARELHCRAGCEEEIQRQRLLLAGPRVEFRHPLIRSAAYRSVESDTLRRVHRTLAGLTSRTDFPDRWARHLVLGARGPDDQLALEIEETAQIARARGGYSAEAALLVHAADLTETLDLRESRLLRAAAAAMNAGAYGPSNEVSQLLDRVEPHLTDPRRIAEAAYLRARAHDPSPAPRLLLEAARLFLPVNVLRTRQILLEAFESYAQALHLASGVGPVEIAEVESSTRPSEIPPSLEDQLLVGTSQLLSGSLQEAFGHYRLACRLIREGSLSSDQVARWSIFGLVVSHELLDDHTYRQWAEQAAKTARQSGALLALLNNSLALATVEVRAGDLLAAHARCEEAVDVAEAIGMPAEHIRAWSVEAYAWAGDDETTRRHADSLMETSRAFDAAANLIMGSYSLTVLHLGAGRYSEALKSSDYVHTDSPIGWTSHSLPLAIEAAVRSGERDLAESLVRRLEERSKASGSSWAMGLTARSKALISTGVEAEEYYQTAIADLRQTLVPRDVAHTQLLYGEWLRRENRRSDARQQLRDAHNFFSFMGSRGFAGRAEAELAATGERVSTRVPGTSLDLTPQELRIATLAAARLTNQEIAAQLFISSATVDYHLRKVFRKLNVGSRRQLAEVLTSDQSVR